MCVYDLVYSYRRTTDTRECDSSGFEHVFVGETRGDKEAFVKKCLKVCTNVRVLCR